jgi:hypothetical protein
LRVLEVFQESCFSFEARVFFFGCVHFPGKRIPSGWQGQKVILLYSIKKPLPTDKRPEGQKKFEENINRQIC